MSVQAGIWNFDGRPADHKLLKRFSDFLEREGPDGESCYIDRSIALLYRPFHTTAESRREKQPYSCRSGFIFTWDGRLDNREELLADLRRDLDNDPTDITIVGAAFDRWGMDCFSRLIGDWAVAIWKPQQRELIFAVDYLAIRHLFYYLKQGQICWATDIAPLVLLAGEKFHVDDDYIAGYFANDPEAHLTPYREIREVPPGQFVRISDSRAMVDRYWHFKPQSPVRYKDDREYEDHFRYLFRQSVRRRLRSDFPVLAELSGGLDSSSIVCMADDILKKEGAPTPRVDTLSYYDKTEPNGDDWIYFQKIENKRGRIGIHLDASSWGDDAALLECSPFSALPGPLGARTLCDQRARFVGDGGHKAILSGIGGDEFMGGVPDCRALLADRIVQADLVGLSKQLIAWSLAIRKPLSHLLCSSLVDLLPAALGQYLAKEARVEPWIEPNFAKRTGLAMRQLGVTERFDCLLPTRRSYMAGIVLIARKLAKFPPRVSVVEELRYPYLDWTLLEFLFSIPATQLLRPGERRSLMRRSLADLVPQEVLSRRTKQVGARTPIRFLDKHWGELQRIYQLSLSSQFGYVRDNELLKTIHEARSGKTVALVRILWAISLEIWLRHLVTNGLIDAPLSV